MSRPKLELLPSLYIAALLLPASIGGQVLEISTVNGQSVVLQAGHDPCQVELKSFPNERRKKVYIECSDPTAENPKKREWTCLAYMARYTHEYVDCVPKKDPDREFRCIFLDAGKGERSDPPGECGKRYKQCQKPGLGTKSVEDLPIAALFWCREEGC